METNKQTTEIVPAVMPKTYGDLKDLVRRVAHMTDWVQLDVMDGKYTTSKSWPYFNKGNHFMQILNGEEGLPFWEEVNYSLDLMTLSPHEEAIRWAEAGVARVILHYNSFKNEEVLRDTIDELQSRMVEVSIAVMPGFDVSKLKPFENIISSVQCMGIENIGFQGEPFSEKTIDTVHSLSQAYPNLTISVDGSVNPETIKDLHQAGARRFAVGSYFFGMGVDIREQRDGLYSLLENE